MLLYEAVNLHRSTTTHKFLRTIETSQTKPRSFFATHVKSLSLSFDMKSPSTCTAKIISVCTGLENLTFWVVPVHQGRESRFKVNPYIPIPHGSLTDDSSLRLPHLQRLSIHCPAAPQFQLPLFAQITHLSILTTWDAWVTWSGFHNLPCLTHISFDLHVGSRSVQSHTSLTAAVSHAVENILDTCKHLQVCALLLLFDVQPSNTAGAVTRQMNRVDSRVVFFRSKDPFPFREREAHSSREAGIWALSDRIAARQRAEEKIGESPSPPLHLWN